jgi:Vilmaviridae head maturation protease
MTVTPKKPTPRASSAKTQAEVAKLHVDTDVARTQVEINKATLQLTQANANKAAAEAESAKLNAEARAIAVRELLHDERRHAASNSRHHVYLFEGAVTENSVRQAILNLTEWSRLEPGCAIEIVFTSPGGSVFHGMALFDYIRKLSRDGHHITTGALGMAASMGGILLQAGDVRWLGRESYVLIHKVSAGASGSIDTMADDVEFYKRVCERIVNVFLDRAQGKITAAKFKAGWNKTDWWLSSDECLAYGFIDEVR